ncbi:MAG: peptide deformylase [Alphaproteobacteria bacterium]|jgi:peptide deformylase|nr:peptide deformylase [Alphaproteobacteria bacterium]
MILNIVAYPNPILKQKAKPIAEINKHIREIAKNMLETMYAQNGIGLAGNQVGELLRIIVIDTQEEESYRPMVLINPEITWQSPELAERDEGCLSLIGVSEIVKRPSSVKVSYTNLEGEKVEIEADGLLATALQHEIDHLDGILFIDRISKLKRDMLIKKYKKAQEEK